MKAIARMHTNHFLASKKKKSIQKDSQIFLLSTKKLFENTLSTTLRSYPTTVLALHQYLIP